MSEEFDAVDAEFSTPRMSEIAAAADGIDDEDLIEREEMVVTVTMTGYIKRTPLALFREQKRGGKGRSGMNTKDEDAVTNLFVTSTHNPVLFFSSAGKVYRKKVWRLPEGGPNAKGRPMVNLLPLAEGETISTVLPLARGRGKLGRAAHHVRHRPRHRAAQLAWRPSPTSRPRARSRCASASARPRTRRKAIRPTG